MDKQQVYVWGFPPGELAGWPPDLVPQPDPPLPAERPVVVFAPAAADFQQQSEAHPLPDSRLSDAIIYLPTGMEIPRDIAFRALVQQGDWRALRRLVPCPRAFRSAELADDVPLAELARPVEVLDFATLGGIDEEREHIQGCETCQDELRDALRERLRLRRRLICPPTAALIAYARQGAGAEVERHLATCPLCSAQVAALRRVVTARVWAEFPLVAARQTLAGAAEAGRRGLDLAGDLLRGVHGPQWQPAVAAARGVEATSGRQPRVPTVDELLADLQRGNQVMLKGRGKQINIGWDKEAAAPVVTLEAALHRPVPDFRLEIRRGEEVVWGADSRAGGVVVPPAEVQEALEQDAEEAPADASYQLVILTRA